MEFIRKNINYFSREELILWFSSILLILVSFIVFDRINYIILAASIIGATSLIFIAKGNPFGQFLMIIFSVLYGIISFKFSYYGEMITYLGMTAPMALFSLISWVQNPYDENKVEVKIHKLKSEEIVQMYFLAGVITCVFYFILEIFNTANLMLSTISVTTSFLAVFLTFRRSAYYAIAYAANDVVLIVLWILATRSNTAYFSVVICFLMFLVNDLYGFINWLKMRNRQFNCLKTSE